MKKREITIKYTIYQSIEELENKDKTLLEQAIKAAEGSYAPYSKFNVGAAVRMNNGEVMSAANQENAAYPSGLCAERAAIFYAHSQYPDNYIEAIAIAAKNNVKLTESPTYPCGSCRQVLSESQMRSGKPIKVILGSSEEILIINSIDDLLPFAFDNLPIENKKG